MADSKKYNGSTWLHSLRKLTTATDIITTLPADLYADGTNASADIIGNMSQTGTPTPQNPIQPQECGERTGNLLYASISQTVVAVLSVEETIGSASFILNKSATQNDVSTTVIVDITLEAGDYILSVIGLNLFNTTFDRIFLRADDSTIIAQHCQTNRPITFTLTETTHINRLSFVAAPSSIYSNSEVKVMLNTGSQPLPYEPYGYKLDIKSANTTTPVYLGEVQSTRKIYKAVLTGQESWDEYGTGTSHFYYIPLSPYAMMNLYPVCSHYTTVRVASEGKQLRIYENYESTTDFTNYLAQQYAAGTPVCVWYVLATPQTAVVNEPLRKIGNYADSVSGISIPTITGADSFDVETTLKPSEVSLAYTGWHDASVGEWDGSQWQ